MLRESTAVSVSATQFFVAGLRSFLRLGFIEGLGKADLSRAALAVTGPPALVAAQGDQQGGSSDVAWLLRSTLGGRAA
ncbi:MAG: hypothetical protein QOK40_2437 [Miltoncostaeaceae bacterium]|nr:hypothetical protein [Miltoncostaeaceae bacterium]